MKALNLITYLKKKALDSEQNFDNKRIVKLLYYIQGYYFQKFDLPAFEDDFKHWEDGPVVKDINTSLSINSISVPIEDVVLSRALEELVKLILLKTKFLSTEELIEMTRSEDPWKEHNIYNELIPKDSIRDYFSKNDPLDLRIKAKENLSEEEIDQMAQDSMKEHSKLFKMLAES